MLDKLTQKFGMIQLDTRPTNTYIILATLIIQPMLIDGIKVAHENDSELKELGEKASQGEAPGFDITLDGILSVSILASFCVWTKSLKCKDVVNRDSTIQSLQVRRIQVPCQPSGRSSHPVRTPICPLFHPSGRRVIPSGR
jgi:hypothetical protein